MAESGTNPEQGLFNIRATPSNEHLVFAETLRDWRDPLLQGYERILVPPCPRCATCKCESLKDLPNSTAHTIHHHHHHHRHEPTCPNFRHYPQQIKPAVKQPNFDKRRAASHDSSPLLLNTNKSPPDSPKCKHFKSKIPVKISTPTSEYSSSSSLITRSHLPTSPASKIPRLILLHNSSSPAPTIDTQYEIDR
ncbi:unnamed protein product [Adineta ricciae]|uniref:Uncharacterized protein n=1 Tax=Adineta ricciae TaxID=249248 RepID=A0A816H603_ADIRI|nr:unnamed protein product [Adineta ricciae]CAF1681914.1 unnamed protein product [Adineta ricciae]